MCSTVSDSNVEFNPQWVAHNGPLSDIDQSRLVAGVEVTATVQAITNTREPLFTSINVDSDTTSTTHPLSAALVDVSQHPTPTHLPTTPHRRLPDDVLIIIFALCIPDPIIFPLQPLWYQANFPISHARQTWQRMEPWNLLAVCTRWYHLILTAPTLWCNLMLQLKEMKQSTRYLDDFQSLLMRSGATTPLKLGIRAEDCCAPVATCLVSELIAKHAWRLRTLSLSLPAPVLDPFFASADSMEFGQLEVIELEYPGKCVVENFLPRRLFRNAPRLKCFSINAEVPIISLEIPWGQLIELHLIRTKGTSSDYLRVLQLCPHLVTCTTSVYDNTRFVPDRQSTPHPSTTMHNLTSFAVDFSPLSQFLAYLDLPALTKVTILSDIDPTNCEATLIPFLKRSPLLMNLTVANWVPSDTIKMILRAVPHITHLQFVPGRTAEVFKLLWAVDIVPNLKCLTFVCYTSMWEEVVEIVGLRGLVGRLREVHVLTFYNRNLDEWKKDPRLQTLREIGVRLELTDIVQGRYS